MVTREVDESIDLSRGGPAAPCSAVAGAVKFVVALVALVTARGLAPITMAEDGR